MIRELHKKLMSGETTSAKLTEQYFDAIEEKKDLNAYLTLTKELAMQQAEEADRRVREGEEIELLAGIPGAIKDAICTKGIRTTAASKILDNYISPYDATVVSRLKEAGAVMLGKTNLDEFAMGASGENSAYGPTRNPYDPTRVAGGSSSGSAAAVGGDLAVWALGSDTGGSIRLPASFCGAVGLKPTYGRVSRYGLIPMASSFDQIGPVAKTVEDAAIVLSAISGWDKMDATSAHSEGKKYENYLTGDIKGLKIGMIKEHLSGLEDGARKLIEKVIEEYKKLGAEICEVELPYNKYALPVYYVVQPSEVSSNMARYDGMKYGLRINDEKDSVLQNENGLPKTLLENYLDTRKYGLGMEVKRRIMLGTYALSSGFYDAYYLKAQKVRALIKKDFERVFKDVDMVLMPTSTGPAFKIGEKANDPLQMYLVDIFTTTANIIGAPAISVPCGKVKEGGSELPIGFQLMGKWFDEESILNAAYAYEVRSR